MQQIGNDQFSVRKVGNDNAWCYEIKDEMVWCAANWSMVTVRRDQGREGLAYSKFVNNLVYRIGTRAIYDRAFLYLVPIQNWTCCGEPTRRDFFLRWEYQTRTEHISGLWSRNSR